jgi:prevent-host-death family protein
MDRIGIRELNQNTSQVLARVSGGETMEITDRGRAVARLVPIADDQSALDRLVSSGRATSPSSTGPIPLPPVWADPGIDVATTIELMRNEERW